MNIICKSGVFISTFFLVSTYGRVGYWTFHFTRGK